MLILDEPTSGLDPEQQREARQLIASLSGDHTIILSTHILSEVEQSCSKVIIINNGEIVASDTVANLHNRRQRYGIGARRGRGRSREPGEAASGAGSRRGQRRSPRQQRHPGGLRSSTVWKTIPCVPNWRAAIVQSGWNLTELRTVGESLEEIFLELTKSETPAPSKDKEEEAVAQ